MMSETMYECDRGDRSKDWFPKACSTVLIKESERLPIMYEGKVIRYACPYCRGFLNKVDEDEANHYYLS